MITVNVRRQGGAAVITIPSDVLKLLDIKVGAELELDVTQEGFIARPNRKSARKRYSLVELLRGVTSKKMTALNSKTVWARKGKPVGREIV